MPHGRGHRAQQLARRFVTDGALDRRHFRGEGGFEGVSAQRRVCVEAGDEEATEGGGVRCHVALAQQLVHRRFGEQWVVEHRERHVGESDDDFGLEELDRAARCGG